MLLKLLGTVNLADLRILEIGSEMGTFKTIEGVVNRLKELYSVKSSMMVELLSNNIIKEIENIGLEANSTTAQVKVLDYLCKMTRDEIFRRDKTVCELTVEAEMIKINIQKMQKTLSEQQQFC